jgi:hypothetical protein
LNTNNGRGKLKKLQRRRGRVKNGNAILGHIRKETKRTMKENKKTKNEEWRKIECLKTEGPEQGMKERLNERRNTGKRTK